MRLKLMVVITLLSSIGTGASAQSISTLWKARGLDAGRELERIQEKLKSISEKDWNSESASRTKCEAMLESAFALHVIEEKVVRKSEGSNDFYHLILSGGESGAFDIAYVYEKQSREPLASRIDRLPKDWHLLFLLPGKVQVIVPKGCVFQFDLKDPFSPQVLIGK